MPAVAATPTTHPTRRRKLVGLLIYAVSLVALLTCATACFFWTWTRDQSQGVSAAYIESQGARGGTRWFAASHGRFHCSWSAWTHDTERSLKDRKTWRRVQHSRPGRAWDYGFSRHSKEYENAVLTTFNGLGFECTLGKYSYKSQPPYRMTSDGHLAIPFSWITLFSGALALFSLSRARKLRHHPAPGRCPRCGYDLRATPTRCPECGHQLTSTITGAAPV